MRVRLALVAAVLLGCVVAPSSRSDAAGPAPAAPDTTERQAAAAGVSAAMQRGDFRQAIAIVNDWASRHPTDLDFRHLEPLLYLLAGDSTGWERARGDLLQSWRRLRDTTPPPARPSFTIDLFDIGQERIVVDQCYERAGRFGVIYRFTVLGPDRQSHSFFTVESTDADNRVARELGHPQPVVTLDRFDPGVHVTVAMLVGLPAYADLRQRVLTYMANPHPISSTQYGQPGLSSEGCEINPKTGG